MQFNKKFFLSILVLGFIAATAGAGTWAEFTSSATANGNTFTAGTMKLALTEAFTFANVAPNQNLGSKTITVTNDGTLDISNVNVVLNPVCADNKGLSSQIVVDSLTLGGNSLLGARTQPTLEELSGVTLSTVSPTLIPSPGTTDLVITCHMKDMDDNYQNAQCILGITFNAV